MLRRAGTFARAPAPCPLPNFPPSIQIPRAWRPGQPGGRLRRLAGAHRPGGHVRDTPSQRYPQQEAAAVVPVGGGCGMRVWICQGGKRARVPAASAWTRGCCGARDSR
eukprot:286822-Chlamydomonas_euryale.AAC.1